MADGDVVLNRNFEVNPEEGTRVELFAVQASDTPGGYYYRFQYYDPDEGDEILRYDNSHDSEVGPHHRHKDDEVTSLEFKGLESHVTRFRKEVQHINARR